MAETTTGVVLGADLEEYLALVRAFPLAHIRDDAHLDAAMVVILLQGIAGCLHRLSRRAQCNLITPGPDS